MRPDIKDRIAKHEEDNRQRDALEHQRVTRAIDHRRTQEEFRKWKEKMGFDMYLTALELLMMLEQMKKQNMPCPDKEWNAYFRTAIELIPEARQFYEDMAMDCTEVKS